MMDSSKFVWIPDENNLFTKGLIVGDDGQKLKVRVEGSSQIRELDAESTEKVNPDQFDQVGDMAELTYLNEPSVVNNLSTRWKNGKIYTYSGLFLVAVNPYKDLPIYDSNAINHFKSKSRADSEPHIYAVAEQAIRNLSETRRDQSILITGESGAGKTENTKKAIQYLSSVTNSVSGGIDERILQTNPILEAFGNAQTIRNANSSRFGKFIKIQFNKEHEGIAGASIQWYLLEKSRVVTQHRNERNYHVFYQLLSGAPESVKSRLLIPNDATPKDFTYLAMGAPSIPGVNDADQYSRLVEAFEIMGFNNDEILSIMSVVACVLHLGQVRFRASSADQGSIAEMADVDRVCHLLGVKPASFVSAVLQPKVKTGREYVTQSRTADQALHTTNAIAKALYERLFGYIVAQLNVRLDEQDTSAANIGVLDIAGFEIFEQNSFEQLCINYTNEKLQQFFNHHMFVLEQEEYIKQKVDWEYVDYGADLQPTIDLIEQSTSPMGIFSCLNEESVLLSGSDASFNEKLIEQWKGKNSKFSPSRLGSGFTIQHYAQTVEYQTDGWMEKNKDPLSDSAEAMLSESTNNLIKSLFASSNTSGISKAKGKSSLFRTVAQRHKEQLSSLMTHLEATHPHFVRCILPNTVKSSAIFDNKLVLDQLRYNGVLEGIRIARSGFPNRVEFSDFCQRYRPLVGSVKGPLGSQHTCATILQRIQLDPSSYKVGLSKVFFKNGVLADLEHRLDLLLQEQALAVQSLARGALVRSEYHRALHRRRAAKVLAKCFKVNLKQSSNPWWQITTGLKPLLVSKEGMDNSRKDIRMQKLESSVNRLREEQVELVSSRNELRAELIASLRAKEEIIEELVQLRKEQKESNEAHEMAFTAARSRDEASSAALTQLSEQHSKLKDSYDELSALKDRLEREFEEKIKMERTKLDESMLKFTADQKESLQSAEKLLEDARNEVADHKNVISELRNELQRSESETARAVDELAKLKEQLKSNEEMATTLKARDTEVTQLKKHLADIELFNTNLKKDYENLKASSALSDKETEDLNASLKEKSAALLLLEEEHQKLTQTHTISNEEVIKLSGLLEEKSKSLQASTSEVSKLREWLSKAKHELKSAATTAREFSTLQEAHKSIVEQLKQSENDLQLNKTEVSNLKKELKNSAKIEELGEANAQLEEAKSKLALANTQLTETRHQLNEARAELKETSSRLNETQSELDNMKASHTETTNQLEKSRIDVSTLNKQLSNSVKLDEYDKMKAQLDASKAEVAALKDDLSTQVKRDEHNDAIAKLSAANAEIANLKNILANSVSAEKLGMTTTQLDAAKAKIAKLEQQAAKTVDASELDTASSRIKRLEADLDLANENLLKINEELEASKASSNELQKKYDELSASSPLMKRELEKSKAALQEAQAQVNAVKLNANETSKSTQILTREIDSLKANSQRNAAELKVANEKNYILEKEITRKNKELTEKQHDIDRLSASLATFDSRLTSSLSEKQKEIESLHLRLESTKKDMLKLQTQSSPVRGVAPNRSRFASSDTEQQLADSSHIVAKLEAHIANLQRDLDSSRHENAKFAIIQQKYEKLQHEKKAIVQQMSQLTLERRLKSREATISQAQESNTKMLKSEINLLGLELARKEKYIKTLEASKSTSQSDSNLNQEVITLRKNLKLTELKYIQLEKQMKATLSKRNNNIAVDKSPDNSNELYHDDNDAFVVQKTRSTHALQNISNDRRVSENHLNSLGEKYVDEESKETALIYRDRANDYLSKLEKAEVVIDSAVRAERNAKLQIEQLKSRLERIDDDHNVELRNLRAHILDARSEIDKRDLLIKDLRSKAALNDELERELRHSNSKLKELNSERDRLSSEKSRLETRLHDMLASSDSSTKQREEQLMILKQNEKQMMREHSELRWKLERKDRLVDQLRSSLSDADSRSEQLREEVDRLQAQDTEKDITIRRITRQVSEAKERYLSAERDLEQFRLSRQSTARIPRDHNQPAFI